MFLRKSWLVVVGVCAFLMGCGQESQAQQGQATKEELTKDAASLEVLCRQLSEESQYSYTLVSGTVERAEKEFPIGDCLPGKECLRKASATFIATMHPIKSAGSQQNALSKDMFFVSTKPETVESLEKKPFYMEEKKSYQFCARPIQSPSEPYKGHKIYQIDSLNSLRELKKTGE